jgi:hypothetical protein
MLNNRCNFVLRCVAVAHMTGLTRGGTELMPSAVPRSKGAKMSAATPLPTEPATDHAAACRNININSKIPAGRPQRIITR